MKRKIWTSLLLCVSVFTTQALELIPKDPRQLDNLLSGENMDFQEESKGWSKPKAFDGEMRWEKGCLYCKVNSMNPNMIATERGVNVKRYKTLFENRNLVLSGKAKIPADLQGMRGAWIGLWWYKENWKPASRTSELKIYRKTTTDDQWVRVTSPVCSMPDDVGVIRIGVGLHQVTGEASFTDIGVYFAEAPFQINSKGRTIKKLKIRNSAGEIVYEKQAPASSEFMLPFPYDFFECEALMDDGVTMKCMFPTYLKIKNGNEAVPLTKIYYQPDAPADMDAAMEAARIIGKFAGKKPEVKAVSKLRKEDVSGSLIIGNNLYQASFINKELKNHTFAYMVKVIDGAVILGGSNPGIRNDAVYRLFENHGFRFYTKTSRDHRYTDSYDREEIFPARDKEIIIDKSYTEKLRFGSLYWPEGGNQGNMRLTRYYRNKLHNGYVGDWHSHDILVPYSVYAKEHPEYYALLPNGKRLG